MGDGIVTVDLPDFLEMRSGSFQLKHYSSFAQATYQPALPQFGPDEVALFSFVMDMVPLGRTETFRAEAFFARLAGRAWCFRFADPERRLPVGVGNGYSEASAEILFTDGNDDDYSLCTDFRLYEGSTRALAKSLALRGADSVLLKGIDTALAGQTILKAGDHLSIGLPSEMNLHMAATNAVCDANGESRVQLINPLWKRALPNDHVEFGDPAGRFVLYRQDPNGSVELVRRAGMLSEGTLIGIEFPYQEPN